MFKALQNSLLSIVYPQQCSACSGSVESFNDGVACGECWTATRIFDGSEMFCDKCGAYFGDAAAPVTVFCHKCDEHKYDKASALGVYEKALSASIINLKTSPFLPERIYAIIPAAVERAGFASADVIIPIPLSRQRQLERGFNQAEIIAAIVSRSTGLPIDRSSLARKLHTPMHRVAMDNKARELTVQNAFRVVRPKLIANKSVLLVDDVFTSGATASNCARVLKKNGATEVNIFTLARAVMNGSAVF